MNTLENLNDWSNDSIIYDSDAAYSITFDPVTPVNQSTSGVEDQYWTSPVGTNITSMVNTPRPIQYTIDLSAQALPATIDWGSLPYYMTQEIVAPNVFRLSGPFDQDIWNEFKNPLIRIIDKNGNFNYTSSITYPNPANPTADLTKSWTVNMQITQVPNITTPSAFVYTKNSPATIAGTPQIQNISSGTYTIVITPSDVAYVYSLSSTGTGGTSVFDPVYKTLTISGTQLQVNSHLNAVVLLTGTNVVGAFTLSYQLTNPSGAIDTVSQNFTSSEPFSINAATYLEDTPITLGYSIVDNSTTATSFTVSVAQSTPLPSANPGYFTVNGSNVGTTWTITDTKATINGANVIFTPPTDYTSTISLTVNQSKVDNGNVIIQAANSVVNIVNAGSNPEITNMIARSFTANTVNNIFSSQTPVINDGPDLGQTYTITLSSAQGKFGNSAANAINSASYTFTGSQTACNSEFAAMKFVPNKNASLSGTFTYTQSRNGNPQGSVTNSLTGSASSIPDATTVAFTGSGSFTPSFNQWYWGNCRIVTVGGGGGGAKLWNTVSQSPGGGGAGGAMRDQFVNLQEGTYSVVIGAGGAFVTSTSGTTVTGQAGGDTYLSLGGTNYFTAGGGGGGRSTSLTPYNSKGGDNSDYAGGVGDLDSSGGGAGAGGAGYSGGNQGGNGGLPKSTNIRGYLEKFGGGGGGSSGSPSIADGYPWGGANGGSFGGAGGTFGAYSPAATNPGGGGGGNLAEPVNGSTQPGNGYKGIVIIKIT